MSADDPIAQMMDGFLVTMAARGYSPVTLRTYRSELKRFRGWLTEKRFTELTEVGRSEIMEYFQFLLLVKSTRSGKPLSAASRNHNFTTVRSFFRHMVKSGQLLSNPTVDIENVRLQRKLPEVPSVTQVLRLLAAIDIGTSGGLRDRAMFELFYGSGIRLSELMKLNLTDLNFDEQTLHIRRGKGNKDRIVPITPEAYLAIRNYITAGRSKLTKTDDPALFVGVHGGRIGRQVVHHAFKKYVKKAGLNVKVTSHTLRHCCATHLLKGRASIRHIQALLGHANLSTTQIYTKVEVSDLREVVRRCHPRESSGPQD